MSATATTALRSDAAEPDPSFENGKLQPYARFDLYAEYRLNPTFSIYARGENLTNARYEEVQNFGTAGRSVYAGMRATLVTSAGHAGRGSSRRPGNAQAVRRCRLTQVRAGLSPASGC